MWDTKWFEEDPSVVRRIRVCVQIIRLESQYVTGVSVVTGIMRDEVHNLFLVFYGGVTVPLCNFS